MINREARSADHQAGTGSAHQPWQCLLSNAPDAGSRARDHATSRPAASEFPFAGSRMLQGLLVAEGCKIGRRHVKTLMQRMGIEALYRRPRQPSPSPATTIHPYLLRGAAITRPNQVWAMDITYIPMARGFVYLAVVLDWFSRRVLSWRLSITMEAAFCVETLEDALACHEPEIFNTDQGSQFTGAAFTGGADQKRDRDQHGRQGRLARQHLRRAAAAKHQIRGGVSAGLRQRKRGLRFDRPIPHFLQRSEAPLEP